MNQQTKQLTEWCEAQLGCKLTSFKLLHHDASPRLYYRIICDEHSWVLMDASQEKCTLSAFVTIAQGLLHNSILVPEIIAQDLNQGWLILSDFGDALLQDALSEQNVEQYYSRAMNLIVSLQQIDHSSFELLAFDNAHIQKELGFFKEWFLEGLLDIQYQGMWEQIFTPIESHIQKIFAEQPQVMIHRDFHSRNLMLLDKDRIGVIDFQDAMVGPLTYDLISLIKDCYISWNETKVLRWQKFFYQQLQVMHSLPIPQHFNRWCDWTSLQRHLKVLGIFSRLKLRDNKPRYLNDITRVLQYVLRVTKKYPELSDFDEGLIGMIQPKLEQVLRDLNLNISAA